MNVPQDEQSPTGNATQPPPRAYTQGVGTVFQFVGVILFLAMMFVCCSTSMLSKDKAILVDLTHIGWQLWSASPDQPVYSAQRAITTSVVFGVFLGLALASLGLGLQATQKRAPGGAVLITALGTVFWLVHSTFAAQVLHSIGLTLLGGLLCLICSILLALSWGAAREMRRDPPADDQAILPSDYKIPYSHMHQDPPEVRLAEELAQRRQRLEVQQKELEMLEKKLKRKFPDQGAQ